MRFTKAFQRGFLEPGLRSRPAHLEPGEDPRAHLSAVNGLAVRAVGSDLLAIRID